jgi:hypothetical protein
MEVSGCMASASSSLFLGADVDKQVWEYYCDEFQLREVKHPELFLKLQKSIKSMPLVQCISWV